MINAMGCGASKVLPVVLDSTDSTPAPVLRDAYFGVGQMQKLVLPDPVTKISDVRLLSGKWLVEAAATNRVLPMRQTLEVSDTRAFLDLGAVKRCLDETANVASVWPTKATHPGILVISYCWHSTKNPDPDGELLKMLAKFLTWYLEQRSGLRPNAPNDCGVFLDFFSLCAAAPPCITLR